MGKLVQPEMKENDRGIFLNVDPEEISRYVIFCGRDPFLFGDDPGLVVNQFLDNPRLLGKTGYYTTYNAEYKGVEITICYTGTGAPELELAIMESIMMSPETDTLIRMGACGGVHEKIKIGNLIIPTGAIREDGCSQEYVDLNFPAMTHHEVLISELMAANKIGARYNIGLMRTSDSMFPCVGKPAYKGYLQRKQEENFEYWHQAGAIGLDRETSLLLCLATLFGLRGGSICVANDNYFTGEILIREKIAESIQKLVNTTLETIYILNQWDKEKQDLILKKAPDRKDQNIKTYEKGEEK
jgi:uridine phosphorylase